MIGNKQKGVSLVEMLVAAVVFSIIFAASTGVFVSAVKIQKYNLNQHELLDQSAYAIEYISRALRMARTAENNLCISTGENYQVTVGKDRIKFVNYKGKCQEFYWDTSSKQIKVAGDEFTGNIPLTSDKYTVNSLSFTLAGGVGGDDLQPRVTFFVDIESEILGDKPRIILQTTISQRNLDK